MTTNIQSLGNHIWAVADLLRGNFRQSQYGRIILPFTVLRRLEAVLEPTRDKVFDKAKSLSKSTESAKEAILKRESGQAFFNTSKLRLSNINNQDPLADMESYLGSFSQDVREIFENFKFSEFLAELDKADLIFNIIESYKSVDLCPEKVSNYEMGLVFEHLIRKFAESANDTAGEHFTPRDMVRLTTSLVFSEDDEVLTQKGVIRHIYDPTCGTGGFLSSGMEYLHELNDSAQLVGFGQELNPESYAICKADMLIKGQDVSNIKLGNTLDNDQLTDKKFDYLLSNPPFGVDWKKSEKFIKDEHKKKGMSGRFGPGTPRVSDGSLLFLLHLVSKMRNPDNKGNGSRIGIILNGSPLFTGSAGSGESEIRRYLMEQDLVETIIALPTDMFFNTGISTYVWVLTNKKKKERKGKVQLINAAELYTKMRKNLGSKRKELSEDQIEQIVKLFGQNTEKEIKDKDGNIILESKIFNSSDFGYRKITIERPLQLAIYPKDSDRQEALRLEKTFLKLKEQEQNEVLNTLNQLDEKFLSRDRFLKEFKKKFKGETKLSASFIKFILKHLSEHDENAEMSIKKKDEMEANSELRDYENVPLSEDIHEYFAREVKPHVPHAWIDESKRDEKDGEIGIVGYEIPFNRYFYRYVEPRSLEEIDKDLDQLTSEIMTLLQEVHS